MFEQPVRLPSSASAPQLGQRDNSKVLTAYRYFYIILPRSVILGTILVGSRFENGCDASRPQERRNRRTLITIILSPLAFYLMPAAWLRRIDDQRPCSVIGDKMKLVTSRGRENTTTFQRASILPWPFEEDRKSVV